MEDDRWIQGYNCGIVAAAAHLKQKASLEKEAVGTVTRDAQLFDECARAILRKMKPVGVELTSIETAAGLLTVNMRGEE